MHAKGGIARRFIFVLPLWPPMAFGARLPGLSSIDLQIAPNEITAGMTFCVARHQLLWVLNNREDVARKFSAGSVPDIINLMGHIWLIERTLLRHENC